MLKSSIQKLLVLVCAFSFLASCAHYGHKNCSCSKDKMACAHHQDGKSDKADQECKDCKK